MKSKSLRILTCFLCLFIICIIYARLNIGEIWALKADFNYRKNNIQVAQNYYEKAFDNGVINSERRNIYINTIINSPLTIQAQKRLIKFLDYPVNDNARLKAEYFLTDLKREINQKYPDNYISNTVYNQKVLRWSKKQIYYSIQNDKKVPLYFVKEIENAFTEWENATENEFIFIENNSTPNIIIKFDENNPADENDKKFVVAYTVPSLEFDRIKDMLIIFYLKDSEKKYFSKNQVYNTALHEIMHALGFMGHCNNKNNIMYLTNDSKSQINDTRKILSTADINTLKLLYRIIPKISDEQKVNGDFLPQLVLGDKNEVNNIKIKEAQDYIKKAPALPAGYIDLAEVYASTKNYEEATRYLKKALNFAETEQVKGIIYQNLAITNFHSDNLPTAKNYLLKSIDIQETEEKQYLLSEIYVREGNIEEAIKEYSKLIDKNPQNVEYTIALTNLYVLNKNYLKARTVLKSYFKNNPLDKANPRFNPYGILRLFL